MCTINALKAMVSFKENQCIKIALKKNSLNWKSKVHVALQRHRCRNKAG